MAVESIEVGKKYRRPQDYPGNQVEVLFVGAERALFRNVTTGHEASITLDSARKHWFEIDPLPARVERGGHNGYVYRKNSVNEVHMGGVSSLHTVYVKTGTAEIGATIPLATLEWLVARVKQDADA